MKDTGILVVSNHARCASIMANSAHGSSPPHQPRPLRDICFRYVAENIHRLESLVDFPEIIGEELWKYTEQLASVEAPTDKACAIVDLFACAYEENALSKLNVNGRHIGLENCMSCILRFNYLREINLSECKLGDEHPLIAQIFTSFQCLTKLGLSDNALSDTGIQRLTSSLRILNQGPKDLQSLDLSCNPKINNRCVKYLRCLKQLNALDLSGTAITEFQLSYLTRIADPEGTLHITFGETSGWLADRLEQWLNAKPSMESSKVVSAFYSRKSRQEFLIQCLPAKIPAPRKPIIFLQNTAANRLTESCPDIENYKENETPQPLNLTTKDERMPQIMATKKISDADLKMMSGYL
ncbi:hypothetical protein CAPTEDRAFT_185261 [Capitella teleta]|uniref:Leucine-rich repeat-containing protein 42 n=1 Tax=Capitella teleta TaxID=283909 RepID=R7T5D2_CAPTE|nr:hypothetical protein CAPTEDRAFT_185261 [Capitella teleta]|eukprot:ELT88318.1 hypothetical protein CAPTEDRAFT_185261 [Capitella teleta]